MLAILLDFEFYNYSNNKYISIIKFIYIVTGMGS